MKKLNNKGFTLVELLAVVVILIIIMLVAIPNMSSSIERRNQKNEAKMKEVIISASELAALDNLCSHSVKYCKIDVKSLINSGYLVEKEVNDYRGYCLIYDVEKNSVDDTKFSKDTCNENYNWCFYCA